MALVYKVPSSIVCTPLAQQPPLVKQRFYRHYFFIHRGVISWLWDASLWVYR